MVWTTGTNLIAFGRMQLVQYVEEDDALTWGENDRFAASQYYRSNRSEIDNFLERLAHNGIAKAVVGSTTKPDWLDAFEVQIPAALQASVSSLVALAPTLPSTSTLAESISSLEKSSSAWGTPRLIEDIRQGVADARGEAAAANQSDTGQLFFGTSMFCTPAGEEAFDRLGITAGVPNDPGWVLHGPPASGGYGEVTFYKHTDPSIEFRLAVKEMLDTHDDEGIVEWASIFKRTQCAVVRTKLVVEGTAENPKTYLMMDSGTGSCKEMWSKSYGGNPLWKKTVNGKTYTTLFEEWVKTQLECLCREGLVMPDFKLSNCAYKECSEGQPDYPISFRLIDIDGIFPRHDDMDEIISTWYPCPRVADHRRTTFGLQMSNTLWSMCISIYEVFNKKFTGHRYTYLKKGQCAGLCSDPNGCGGWNERMCVSQIHPFDTYAGYKYFVKVAKTEFANIYNTYIPTAKYDWEKVLEELMSITEDEYADYKVEPISSQTFAPTLSSMLFWKFAEGAQVWLPDKPRADVLSFPKDMGSCLSFKFVGGRDILNQKYTTIHFGGISRLSDRLSDILLTTLTTVHLDDVERIAPFVFRRTNIATVTAPNVREVGESCFAECEQLTLGHFPKLTVANNGAFQQSGLVSFSAPNLQTIASDAFYGCEPLETVKFHGTRWTIGQRAFMGCILLKTWGNPTERKEDLFEGSHLNGMFVHISTKAFAGCSSLTVLDMTASEAFTFGSGSFTDSGLLVVKLPQLQAIPSRAFFNCTKLRWVEVYSSQIDLTGAFVNCGTDGPPVDVPTHAIDNPHVKIVVRVGNPTVQVAGTPARVCGCTLDVDYAREALKFCGKKWRMHTITSIICDGNILAVAPEKFHRLFSWDEDSFGYILAGNENGSHAATLLEAVGHVLAADWELDYIVVGDDAWATTPDADKRTIRRMLELNTIYVHTERVSAIGSTPLEVVVHNDAITRLDGPPETTSIDLTAYQSTELGENLFRSFHLLEEARLPHPLRVIHRTTFHGLTAPTLDFSNTMLVRIPAGAFHFSQRLEELNLSNTHVRQIRDRTFEGLTRLKRIVFPDMLAIIGERAFSQCSLEQVNLADTRCAHIKRNAFLDCHRLTTVKLPTQLEHIAEKAFQSCTSLREINLEDTSIPVLEDGVFVDCTALETIAFPKTLEKMEKTTFERCVSLVEVDARAAEDFDWDGSLLTYFETCDNLDVIRTVGEVIPSDGEEFSRERNMYVPENWESIVEQDADTWLEAFGITEDLKYPHPDNEGIEELRRRVNLKEAIHPAFDPEFHLEALSALLNSDERFNNKHTEFVASVDLAIRRLAACKTKLTTAQQRQKIETEGLLRDLL